MAGQKDGGGFSAEELRSLGEGPEGEVSATDETEAPETEDAESSSATATEETPPEVEGSKPNGKDGHGGGDLTIALREEREKRREVERRIAKMEGAFEHYVRSSQQPKTQQQQKPEEQVPDYNTDPIGHLKGDNDALRRQLENIAGNQQKFIQQQQMQEFEAAAYQRFAADTKDFVKEVPDFDQAYTHLQSTAERYLISIGMDDPQQRNNEQQRLLGATLGKAWATQQNPAKMLYEAAKTLGYVKAAPKAPGESKIAVLAKGAQAAKSISGAKGTDNDGMSLERLAELYDEDPPAADVMFNKMKRRGMLG